MRGLYCYLPILRAKAGEFSAVRSLSPAARSRLTPLFDVTVQGVGDTKAFDTYLEERAAETYSVGDHDFYRRAQGVIGPGSPTGWVAADTNHHLELVSAQAWHKLYESGLLDQFALRSPEPQPWLQPDLVS